MTGPRTYASAAALRAALEARLQKQAEEEGFDLQRMRRQVAFDRLLCRLFAPPDAPWILKGGYAMELRVKASRTTRDLDLAMIRLPIPWADWEANAGSVLETLREAGRANPPDYFAFLVGEATMDLEAAPMGGARFPIDGRLAGRTFAKFHLDVSSGDIPREPCELLSGRDWLGFAGIASQSFPTLSPEEQFAEKLHAYTRPREGRENSRVKDLIDLVLLIERSRLDPNRLSRAVRHTFHHRKTHGAPAILAAPPAWWSAAFAEMARECGLEPNIEDQFKKVGRFLGKIAR